MNQTLTSKALSMLDKAKIILTEEEKRALEVTDLGLGNLQKEGLQVITYVNNERYCAKELILLPNQTCPEHFHPPVGSDPGKTETFRCRWGIVYLYIEGEETKSPQSGSPER